MEWVIFDNLAVLMMGLIRMKIVQSLKMKVPKEGLLLIFKTQNYPFPKDLGGFQALSGFPSNMLVLGIHGDSTKITILTSSNKFPKVTRGLRRIPTFSY